jgi:hypothetical protein
MFGFLPLIQNCLEMVVKKYIQKVIEKVKETVLKL